MFRNFFRGCCWGFTTATVIVLAIVIFILSKDETASINTDAVVNTMTWITLLGGATNVIRYRE